MPGRSKGFFNPDKRGRTIDPEYGNTLSEPTNGFAKPIVEDEEAINSAPPLGADVLRALAPKPVKR